MGIEFSYAAETAFVSPTLLKIGVEHRHMTLVWALSPLVGFFVTPILGSMSDRCKLNIGRRRPFIILLSIGVFLGKFAYFNILVNKILFDIIGLLLVPHGEDLGYMFGDMNANAIIGNNTSNNFQSFNETISKNALLSTTNAQQSSHTWGIFFTILGTVLLDFDADACQSPSRAYLLDVCIPGMLKKYEIVINLFSSAYVLYSDGNVLILKIVFILNTKSKFKIF